ncbi:MAG TPA: aldose 1-epimerase family protein [Conexibacter sp.]|nr:aldose 1-epimerase family protein [Conexibacter sp.]
MELFGERIEAGELRRRVGRLEQVAGVRLVTLGDGGERGLRVLEFRTGAGFEFELLVDRCMDVGRCALHGRSLAWESPTGHLPPERYEPEGNGWLRSFGAGLMTTGGLDHIGGAEEGSGLHGRASSLPARLCGYGTRTDADGGLTLWAEGEIVQTAVFGERLVLRRRVEARVGERSLRISDTVANEGYAPAEQMLLYHVNAGWPLLDAGAELLVPARSVRALHAGGATDGYTTMLAPQPGWSEQVFEHDNAAEADGRVPVALVNRARGFGLYELYRRDQFPYHWTWRMLGESTYVLGIEPATDTADGRAAARERGELTVLAPGEARDYELELGALDGAQEIDAFAARVAALTG